MVYFIEAGAGGGGRGGAGGGSTFHRYSLRDRRDVAFINGVADYEHQFGASHAFTDEQVQARVRQIEAAGFNAFRDAHHPHNLRFNEHWDHDGLLWWTQFGAHIWFENEAFQANYKMLLRDWVRERRNSPSLVLWGLQNESKLPAAFAAECAAIIPDTSSASSSESTAAESRHQGSRRVSTSSTTLMSRNSLTLRAFPRDGAGGR